MKKIFLSFKEPISNFTAICIWLIPAGILIRLFELLFIIYQKTINNNSIIKLNLLGFFYDVIALLSYLPILFLLFFVIYKWDKKVATIGLRIFFSLMLFISISLVIFYVNATFPLDSVLFNYSFRELLEIITTSQAFVWWAYLFLLAIPLAYFFASSTKIPRILFLSFILWICIFLSWVIKDIDRNDSQNKSAYYTTINKVLFFVRDVYKSKKKKSDIKNKDISDVNIRLFQSYFKDLEFVSLEYPFLHKDATPDRLSSFFNLKEEPPHIVFIIIEGLGSAFCGPGSIYPSPTPFLDSLARNSLFWQNCFSVSPRTAGVLPAILGSLPYGAGGFMNYQLQVPDFHSLPLILKKNGYRNAFFYGGWHGFDYMKTFTNINGFSHYLINHESFDKSQRTKWGIFDKIMFEEAIKTIDFNNKQKRFDLYLTLTTHGPFDDYPEVEKHIKQYRNIIDIEKDKKSPSHNNIQPLASYIYIDTSVRHCINLYRQTEGFDNTIFLITGDHYFDQTTEQISNTRVPLMIWSPMLQTTGIFKSLVSHREVTPSILSLLKNNYNINMPDHVAWLNNGLDTNRVFVSNLFLPQMHRNRGLNHFIYNNHYIENDKQCLIYEKKHFLEIGEEQLINETNKQLIELYRALDMYVMEKNKLVENNFDDLSSMVLYELNEGQVVEYGDIYSMNIFDFEVDIQKLHSVNVYFEFDIKTEPDTNNTSVKVVTQIKCENHEAKYSMTQDIFDDANIFSEWTHFNYHYMLSNDRFNFEKNKRIVIFIYNPEDIPSILVKNRKYKIVINRYK